MLLNHQRRNWEDATSPVVVIHVHTEEEKALSVSRWVNESMNQNGKRWQRTKSPHNLHLHLGSKTWNKWLASLQESNYVSGALKFTSLLLFFNRRRNGLIFDGARLQVRSEGQTKEDVWLLKLSDCEELSCIAADSGKRWVTLINKK